jgi:DNA-directed RNA polymerase
MWFNSTVDGKKTRKVLNASLPKEFRVSIREETDVLDEAKQASGVAPNFIHSLDASALVLTVNKMVAEGYKSFALIHDSFAVHACDSARLASALREAFVEMYTQHDPFKELFNGFRHMLTAIGADKAAIKKLNDLESQHYPTVLLT